MLCVDGSTYVGSARGETAGKRIGEHQAGLSAYTRLRHPVVPVFVEQFAHVTDAITAERRIKGWSQAKGEALFLGEWRRVQWLAKRRGTRTSTGRCRTVRPTGSMPPNQLRRN